MLAPGPIFLDWVFDDSVSLDGVLVSYRDMRITD